MGERRMGNRVERMPENKTWDDRDEGREREVNTSERGEGWTKMYRRVIIVVIVDQHEIGGVYFLPLQLC